MISEREPGSMTMNKSNLLIYYDCDEGGAIITDCDCACPQTYPAANPPLLANDEELEQPPSLKSYVLTPEFKAVFVPSISRVAVINAATADLLDQFRTARTVAGLDNEEQQAIQQLYQLGLLMKKGEAPLRLDPSNELIAWVHVTNQCNLRCTYCYINKSNESMTPEVGLAAIDTVLRSAQQYGYTKIFLKYAGGEASLNLRLIEQLHAYAQKTAAEQVIEVRGVILSNGVGLNRQKLERIRDLGLRLMISLDGTQATHNEQRPTVGGAGTHYHVVATIELARTLDVALTISVTVTDQSIAGLPELVAWLRERDLHFTLNFYREHDHSTNLQKLQLDEQRIIEGMRKAYRVIEQRLLDYSLLGCLLDRSNLGASHQRACAVGENYFVIDHRGGISSCQMKIEQAMTTIWEEDPLGLIRLDLAGVQNLSVEQKEGCRTCEWRYWCAGGCPLATFRATGRYDMQSPNCAVYKALIPDLLHLEGLRLLKIKGG
jgi:uncharacterized protein